MSSYCCAYCPATYKSVNGITKHLESCRGRECSELKKELEEYKRLAGEVKALRKLLKKCRNRLIDMDGFDDDNKDLIEEIENKIQGEEQ